MCKTISQKVRFRAEPADVYRLLVTEAEQVGSPFCRGEGTGIVVDSSRLASGVVRAWREKDYPKACSRWRPSHCSPSRPAPN